MLSILYMITRLEYIYKNLLVHNKINENIAIFNNKSAQLQREITFIKSKSFDTADTNIVLQHRSVQINHEIELLKYKQRCCHAEIQHLKDLYKKISE